ncbi:MAG: PqqD family protein [Clostridiales bacterium]|nr:PqqD family protein [Clostridiales bacterium]
MKLNDKFLLHNAGSESILVPVGGAGFSGVVRGNKTLGAILELLKKDATEAEIIASMKGRFDAPEGAIERDVATVLAELRKIGALDE